jgi:hypothetical protein
MYVSRKIRLGYVGVDNHDSLVFELSEESKDFNTIELTYVARTDSFVEDPDRVISLFQRRHQ